MQTAYSIDGIALSYRSADTDPYGLHRGSIVRHIVRNDTVAGDSVLFDSAGARSVCISPDGARVAFIRAGDGMLCIMGIHGQALTPLCRVSPDALSDWTNETWIYFTKIFNHITLKRISVINGQSQTIGWFPVGVTHLAVSADTDSVHGIAVLDSGSAQYTVATFDYRGFLIYKHAGCIGHISPGGGFYSVGSCADDTANYHKKLLVYAWGSDTADTLLAASGEYFARGNWSVNSDDWLVMTVGKDRELLACHDMMIIARDNSSTIRVTANDSGHYSEACDFWVGDPDSALAKIPQMPVSARRHYWQYRPAGAGLSAGPGAAYAVYRPDGRYAGSHHTARLPSGVYILQSRMKKNRLIFR